MGKLNRNAKLSTQVRYSERFQELELESARHILSTNNQRLGIG
ncbi:MAG TPA: hypothetical protein VIQ04_06085 [Nitrososphaeraceae archaeon]